MFVIGLLLIFLGIAAVNLDPSSPLKKTFDKRLAVDCFAGFGLVLGLDLICAAIGNLAWQALE